METCEDWEVRTTRDSYLQGYADAWKLLIVCKSVDHGCDRGHACQRVATGKRACTHQDRYTSEVSVGHSLLVAASGLALNETHWCDLIKICCEALRKNDSAPLSARFERT
jgi:hypothetical protein